MKRLLFFLFIISITSYGQVGYVEYDHPVYHFMERMSSQHFIENYDPFELPKTRSELTAHLRTLINSRNILNEIDRTTLDDYLIEFEYDLSLTGENYYSLFPEFNLRGLATNKEKYIYSFTDTNKFSLFVNAVGSLEHIYLNDRESKNNYSSLFGVYGGSIRGTVLKNFGFSINSRNGIFSGDRETARLKNNLLYNFKFNENSQADDSKYFDETEGYILAEFDYIKFKLGRDRRTIGFGNMKHILSENPPPMDYFALDIKYKILTFSFMHGSLLGKETSYSDSTFGTIRTVDEKFIAYHRLGINFGRHLKVGFGEVVIYGGRPADFSYFNPFNFYKSVEHANGDRDNSQLFIDISNNSVRGLKLYAAIVLDDIDFSKIGTGWFGNQALFNFVIYSSNLNRFVPVDLQFQYLRIDPYFYTHRLQKNNYTSSNFALGSSIPPNSETIAFTIYYRPHHRVNVKLNSQLTKHGANELNGSGFLVKNYGGDILVGHRSFDSNNAGLLQGIRQNYSTYNLSIEVEPINNYFVNLSASYQDDQLQNEVSRKLFYTNLKIYIRI